MYGSLNASMIKPRIYIALLCTWALTALVACENDPAEVEALTKPSIEVEEAGNVTGTLSQSGKLKAILKAPQMLRVKADTVYTEFPASILVNFYNEAGVIESTVTARYAQYFDLLRKVYLRDSVVVYNTVGDTLFAEDLWWDQNREIFYSDRPVRVVQPTQQLTGTGITATADFKSQTIRDPRGPVALPSDFVPQ